MYQIWQELIFSHPNFVSDWRIETISNSRKHFASRPNPSPHQAMDEFLNCKSSEMSKSSPKKIVNRNSDRYIWYLNPCSNCLLPIIVSNHTFIQEYHSAMYFSLSLELLGFVSICFHKEIFIHSRNSHFYGVTESDHAKRFILTRAVIDAVAIQMIFHVGILHEPLSLRVENVLLGTGKLTYPAVIDMLTHLK